MNAEHPESTHRYTQLYCYSDGTLVCESTEEFRVEGFNQTRGTYRKETVSLLPQFIEVVKKASLICDGASLENIRARSYKPTFIVCEN